jgi:thioester reductase-like protein
VLLMTGFPGFLGSALLPRLLARREATEAVCIVQHRHLALAKARLATIEATQPHSRDRIRLVEGDITVPDLGLSRPDRAGIKDADEVWHLAAVYDLSVAQPIAHRVNVDGTARVIELCQSLPGLSRLQYVSTCYVSGRYDGTFTEDDLDVGQDFLNHYESTKYEAELLVRAAMQDGLPTTVYRPGIVVGDSRTGETQKFDGPYMYATFLQRQPGPFAFVPLLKDPDTVEASLVPRDFVIEAMDVLSVLDASRGRTYALTDPQPPTIREAVDLIAAHLGKRIVWTPLPLRPVRALLGAVPGLEKALAVPAEALDYLVSPTRYDTAHAQEDLERTGVECPRFASYADRMLDFWAAHPEIGSEAMI